MRKIHLVILFISFFSSLFGQIDTCFRIKSVQKISDTQGNFTALFNNSDRFESICNLGDFNGDGINDIIAGAKWDDDGGTDKGAIYILYMNANATVNSFSKISDLSGNFSGVLINIEVFGISVDTIGDLNNDGVMDIVVGASEFNSNQGAVHVLFLNANGTVQSSVRIADGLGGLPAGLIFGNAEFGSKVSCLEDLNGDGNNELLVGAFWINDGGLERGAVFILFLNNNGTVQSYKKISSTSGNFTGILDDSDGFGMVVDLGDYNNDGIRDIAVGAIRDDDGGLNKGAVWILSIDNTGNVVSHAKISDTSGNFSGILASNDEFGSSVASLDDVDGDGVGDILVGSTKNDNGGTDRGAAYLLFLNPNGSVKKYFKVSSTTTNFTGYLDNNDWFGMDVSGIGDFDNNGVMDIMVSSGLDDDGGAERGAFYIILLENICPIPCNPDSATTFQKVYGGTGNERAHSVDKTNDGGYIIAGETTSFGAGNKDWFVMKINANGVEQWSKTYGSTSVEDGFSITIKQTNDLGYIICGYTEGFGAGSFFDSFVIKLDNLGNIQWEKRVSGSSYDQFRDVIELSNGDFLLTGSAQTYSAGFMDAHVAKISSSGNLIWVKNLGTSSREHSQSIIELPGGNYLLSGSSNLSDPGSNANAYLSKIDADGNFIQSKQYGLTSTYDDFNDIILLGDGNILNIGETESYGAGNFDIWLVKTDTNGNVIWSKTYGGNGIDIGVNVREKSNGELIISAYTGSYGSNNQLLLINTDSGGNIIWSKTYGGANNEELDWCGNPMTLNTNEEIIVVGGSLSFGSGNEDVYVVKTNECGQSFCNEQDIMLTSTSPNIISTILNKVNNSGGALVNTNSIVNTINFTDNYLCVDTVPSPTCNLSSNFSSTSTCYGDTTYFTDLSIDSIGNIVDWNWNFGDGTTLAGIQNPQYFYTSSGNFNVTLVVTNDNNCSDSITIPVTIHSTTTSTQNLSICQGDSVLFGGQFYNVTGIYSDSLQSSFGCDSIHSLNLNVISSFQIFQNQIICQGDSIFLGGNYQFLAGIYTDSLQATSGCDSVVFTTLTINPTFTSNQNTSICQGDSILLGGSFQTTAGIYSDNYSSSNGCDSTVNTTLTIHPTEIINQNIDICQGDSILLGGAFQTSAGIYTDVYNSVLGCDSTVNTTLTIKSPSTETLNPITICDNDSALIFGVYQNIAGIYNQVIPNCAINGCDSIVYQELLINSTYEIFANKTICQGDSIFLGGSFQTSNGIYTDVYNSSLGCDSTITTTLNVVNNFLVNVNDTICQGDSIFIAGAYQSLTGTYSEILTSSAGCDSLVITNLMVDSVINLIISDDAYTSACESAELHVSGGSSYFWSPSSGLSCTNCSNPIASPFETTTYTVTDVGSNCSRNNTVTVYVQGENEVFVPNVFTPNKNGQNDGFNIKASCIKSIHKLIYNRWGMVVFESNQINEVWDGRTTSGSEVPDGTYFYIFEVTFDINNQTDAKKVFKGTVTLLR